MPLNFAVIDAFTTKPLGGGNPASVVVLPGPSYPSDDILHLIALEFNLSETAFLIARLDDPDSSATTGSYNLRWFTPATEVDLCGHATLASSHVLFSSRPELDTLRFHTKSGVLIAKVVEKGSGGRGPLICLDFPEKPAKPLSDQEKAAVLPALLKGLEIPESKIVGLGKAGYATVYDLFVEISPDVNLKELDVKPQELAIPQTRAVLVGALATPALHGSDIGFVSRFFAPNSGIPEDPVTGSAHCVLAPHYGLKLGRFMGSGHPDGDGIKCLQLSPRGGELEVVWDRKSKRVLLWGRAVRVSEGQFFVEV
ncbi:hypothetical protein HDU96_010193 [Phlyctochytrium bullatum]|nr:hypothetical protein HDU96_010193 [Phlyctochytrium bullatum]